MKSFEYYARLAAVVLLAAAIMAAGRVGQAWAKATSDVTIPTVPASGAAESKIVSAYVASVIPAGSGAAWQTNVALTDNGPTGEAFSFVIFFHIPTDFGIGWARQISSTLGTFPAMTTKDDAAATWISNPANCPAGGAAASGYKWKAWTFNPTALPSSGRASNLTSLKGGLQVGGSASSGDYRGVRVVVGTYYDSNSDSTPDTYDCFNSAEFNVNVP